MMQERDDWFEIGRVIFYGVIVIGICVALFYAFLDGVTHAAL